jgi:hypothetical protein
MDCLPIAGFYIRQRGGSIAAMISGAAVQR